MKFNVHDRLMLLGLLPKEGNFFNLKLVRKAREALTFGEEEVKSLNIRTVTVNGQELTAWDDGVSEKEIEFGDTVRGIIIEELTKLDKANQLKEDHLSLYEKFMIQ